MSNPGDEKMQESNSLAMQPNDKILHENVNPVEDNTPCAQRGGASESLGSKGALPLDTKTSGSISRPPFKILARYSNMFMQSVQSIKDVVVKQDPVTISTAMELFFGQNKRKIDFQKAFDMANRVYELTGSYYAARLLSRAHAFGLGTPVNLLNGIEIARRHAHGDPVCSMYLVLHTMRRSGSGQSLAVSQKELQYDVDRLVQRVKEDPADTMAKLCLAYAYSENLVTASSTKIAQENEFDLLYGATRDGNAQAQLNLGLFLSRKTDRYNMFYAIQWCRKAAEQHDPAAQYALCKLLHDKRSDYEDHMYVITISFVMCSYFGRQPDEIKWLKSAARNNHVPAMVEYAKLAPLIEKSDGNTDPCRIDDRETLQWLEKAAAYQHPLAMYELGTFLRTHPTLHDHERGLELVARAASMDHADAQVVMVDYFLRAPVLTEHQQRHCSDAADNKSDGTTKKQRNLNQAMGWLQRACEQGHYGALLARGLLPRGLPPHLTPAATPMPINPNDGDMVDMAGVRGGGSPFLQAQDALKETPDFPAMAWGALPPILNIHSASVLADYSKRVHKLALEDKRHVVVKQLRAWPSSSFELNAWLCAARVEYGGNNEPKLVPEILGLAGHPDKGMCNGIFGAIMPAAKYRDLASVMTKSLLTFASVKNLILSDPQFMECIVHDMFAAVCHLHERGIVHRDIKLSKFLLNENGRVQICGFRQSLLTDDKRGIITPQLANQIDALVQRGEEFIQDKLTSPNEGWSDNLHSKPVEIKETSFDQDLEQTIDAVELLLNQYETDKIPMRVKQCIDMWRTQAGNNKLTARELVSYMCVDVTALDAVEKAWLEFGQQN